MTSCISLGTEAGRLLPVLACLGLLAGDVRGQNLLASGTGEGITLVTPAGGEPLEDYAVAELARHIETVTGTIPTTSRGGDALKTASGNVILIGRTDDNAALSRWVADSRFEVNREEQGYSLWIGRKSRPATAETWMAVLCGADPRGVLYAVRDFCHYHFYRAEGGPVLAPAEFSYAPPIKVRYVSESGCNLFSAENDDPKFMRDPSLNGYSRRVVFDKPYYLDWLSQSKATHLNVSWVNAPAYEQAWQEMMAYAQSRGIRVWRHFVPFRPQHEYPPPHVSGEAPTSRNGDCPRAPVVRQWYLDRLEQIVTQQPLVAGIVIESPYHDGIYCQCRECRGKENPFPEAEMLDEFVGLARRLRPELEVVRVTKRPVPNEAAARQMAAELGSRSESADYRINTYRNRTHRARWHDLGPGFGTYLRTFRSALKGKNPSPEIDFLYNDFQQSAARGVVVHGFCYRFYNARYGSFPTQEDRARMAEFPEASGPLSLALVAEAAFEPNPSPERRRHKLERLTAQTIPDYPPANPGAIFKAGAASSEPNVAAAADPAPHALREVDFPPPSKFFRMQYGLVDGDAGYTIAAVCANITGDARREIVYASRRTKELHLLDAATGTTLWRRKLAGDHQSISAFDLDGDGRLEILYTTSSPGCLYVLDATGRVLHSWDSGDWKLGNSPVVLDGDGDGNLDGYLGSRGKDLLRLRMSDLTVLERRRGWVQCGCYTSALDIDADGRWDLFAGSGDDKRGKGVLHRYDPLSLQSVWSYRTDDNASSADPVLADIDGDGRVEIIKSVDNYAHDDAHDGVYAFTPDGSLLWKAEGFSGEDSPNIADLDGDGSVEIVGMTFGCEVYCLDSKGRVKWRRDLRPEIADATHAANLAPILCDLDGDQELEILAITNGGYFDSKRSLGSKANGVLFALSARGEILDRFEIGKPRCWNNALVCNVDADPAQEIVLSGCGHMDVIQTGGFGPDTEHFQRRRTYQRLNVVPWAYEDSYFIHRGTRKGLVNLTDNLVLERNGSGYRSSGRFITELCTLPPEGRFSRLEVDARTPPDTGLQVNILDSKGKTLIEGAKHAMSLDLRQPVALEFILSTTDPLVTPVLDAYRLSFDRR